MNFDSFFSDLLSGLLSGALTTLVMYFIMDRFLVPKIEEKTTKVINEAVMKTF